MKTKRISKSSILIVVIVAIMVIAIGIIAAINDSQSDENGRIGTLTILAGDDELKTYTVSELKEFAAVENEKNITSHKDGDESGIFTGVPLETILDDAASGWRDKFSEFIFHTSDGFVASVYKSDIEKGENVLVTYAKDGVDFKGPDDGGKGPLRIIVVDDPFGNRSAYLLTSIEMN